MAQGNLKCTKHLGCDYLLLSDDIAWDTVLYLLNKSKSYVLFLMYEH